MARKGVHLLLLAALLGAAAFGLHAGKAARLDASTVDSTQASFERMLQGLPAARRSALLGAVLLINLEGVRSARELAANPDLQDLSVLRIKHRIDGMTADEIIALADTLDTPQIQSIR